MSDYKIVKEEGNLADASIEKSNFKVHFSLKDIETDLKRMHKSRIAIDQGTLDQEARKKAVAEKNPKIVELIGSLSLSDLTAYSLYHRSLNNYAEFEKQKRELETKLVEINATLGVERATMENIVHSHPNVVGNILKMELQDRADFIKYDTAQRYINEATMKKADMADIEAEYQADMQEISKQCHLQIIQSDDKPWMIMKVDQNPEVKEQAKKEKGAKTKKT